MDLRGILDTLPAAVIYTDEREHIQDCNQTACTWFGYEYAEMLGASLASLLWTPPVSQPLLLDHPEVLWLRKGGEVLAADVTRHSPADGTGGTVWVLYDGAPERAARLETSRRLLESREAERLRMARELHDGAIQELIGICFGLADVQRSLTLQAPQLDLQKLDRQQTDLKGLVRMLRALVSELRPAGLSEFGLAAAIEGLVAKMARQHAGHTQIRLELEPLPELDRPCELCLYRCTQEALQNALRHARADHILVRLRQVGPITELSVEDDGLGFEVPARLAELTRSHHYGLAGMAERVELVAGSLTVHSRSGGGTAVRLAVSCPGTDAVLNRRPYASSSR